MPHYHLFYLSAEDSQNVETAIFDAPDEAAALSLIAEGAFEHPLELWSGHNQIKRFESGDAPVTRPSPA